MCLPFLVSCFFFNSVGHFKHIFWPTLKERDSSREPIIHFLKFKFSNIIIFNIENWNIYFSY